MGTGGPPASVTATVTASYSDAGSNPDSGGVEEKRRTKK